MDYTEAAKRDVETNYWDWNPEAQMWYWIGVIQSESGGYYRGFEFEEWWKERNAKASSTEWS